MTAESLTAAAQHIWRVAQFSEDVFITDCPKDVEAWSARMDLRKLATISRASLKGAEFTIFRVAKPLPFSIAAVQCTVHSKSEPQMDH